MVGSLKILTFLICEDHAGKNRKEKFSQVRVRSLRSLIFSLGLVFASGLIRNSWTRKEIVGKIWLPAKSFYELLSL